MKKLLTLFLALAASVGMMFAEKVQIGDLYYNLDATNLTAEVTYQYEWSDDNYSGLTNAIIPSTVTYNDQQYSVTSIGYIAFTWCSGLTSVIIGNSVTSIGNYAFDYCSGLTSVTIPNSVTSIGEGAFRSCSGMTEIVVSAENPNYCSDNGVLFNKDKTALIQYPGDKQGEYTIPNSVTSIGYVAFQSCFGLTSVEIPNSVTSIGNYAFAVCSGLTSITIPNSVTSIGDWAFYYCSGLTEVTIPNSVTSIGSDAFYGCSGLTSVTNYATTPQTLDIYVFYNVNKSSCTLYVPEESVNLYKSAEVWKDFTNIQAIADEPEPEGLDCTIRYVDKDENLVSSENLTFHVPAAPEFEGFTFVKWIANSDNIEDGITIQAVYKANEPTTAPAVYTNPANPAQKLIREGNVYILRGDKTYTLQGQKVR